MKLGPVGFVSCKPRNDFSQYSITLVKFRYVNVKAKITRRGEGDSNFAFLVTACRVILLIS